MRTLDDFDIDPRLAAHLRRTLHAVADTIDDDVHDQVGVIPEGPSATRPRTRRRALALVAVLALGAVSLVGWKVFNPDAIVRIPTEEALMGGAAEEGGAWWLLPTEAMTGQSSSCNPPESSVVFVSAASNRSGDEMNAGGVVYGEPSAASPCHDVSSWLANPARFDIGRTRLGPSNDGGDESTAWGYFATVHPSVTKVRVTADDHPAFEVLTAPLRGRPDGPRFAGFTTSPDTRLVTVQLIDEAGTIVIEWPLRSGG